MSKLSERSGWYKIALLSLGLGFISMAFGVGYPSWVKYEVFGDKFKAGLWQFCTETMDECGVYKLVEQTVWFEVVRGVLVASLLLYIVTIIIALKQTCSHAQNWTLEAKSTIICSFITASISMTATIIYGIKIELGLYANYSFSYWLTMLGSGLAFAAGLFLSVSRRSYRGTVIKPATMQQDRFVPPPRYQPPGPAPPPSLGGPMMPGYPPRQNHPTDTTISGGGPGYPPTGGFVYNQGYLGPPPAYSSLPGQIDSVGSWPAGNIQPPPPPVYNESTIKQ